MLTTLDELLPKYLEKDAAVGAFNLAVFPDIPTLISAAEEMKHRLFYRRASRI